MRPMELTDSDLDLVRETLREIEATPPPRDPGPLGCPMALLGAFALIAFPALVGRFPVLNAAGPVVLLAALAVLVVGIVIAMTAGGWIRGASRAAVEAALRTLSDPEVDRDVALRAATLLIAHAHVSYGPTMTSTVSTVEARPRIEPSLPLVLAVEAHLVQHEGLYPVFTADEEPRQATETDADERL